MTRFCFGIPNIELPWRSFDEFHDDLTRTQPGGYLGVELRGEHRHIARELNRYPYHEDGAAIILERPRPGFWIAAVYVDPTTPEQGAHQWAAVSKYFHHLLRLSARRLALYGAGTIGAAMSMGVDGGNHEKLPMCDRSMLACGWLFTAVCHERPPI